MPGETGGCGSTIIMNINRRMMVGGGLSKGQNDEKGMGTGGELKDGMEVVKRRSGG